MQELRSEAHDTEAAQDQRAEVAVKVSAWPARARCRGTRDVFYNTDEGAVRRARAFCAACDVWDRCLTGALDRQEPYGVWGGLTSAERRRLRLLQRRLRANPRDPANRKDLALLLRVTPAERLARVLGVVLEEMRDGRGRLAG